MANVSKAEIKKKLATMLKAKEDCISVYGLKTKFGGGRSSGFALVYDNFDARKKYDMKRLLRRVSFLDLSTSFIIRMVMFKNQPKQENKRKKSKEE